MNTQELLESVQKLVRKSLLKPFADIQQEHKFPTGDKHKFSITYNDSGKELKGSIDGTLISLLDEKNITSYMKMAMPKSLNSFSAALFYLYPGNDELDNESFTWDNSKTLVEYKFSKKFRSNIIDVTQSVGVISVTFKQTKVIEFDDNFNITFHEEPEFIGVNIFKGKKFTLDKDFLFYANLKEV